MNLLRTVCLILIISDTARAQDNHYSWMQYGSRNSILYNAGISRFEDQSAIITNPATLSHARSPSFNFNSNIVGYTKITFENGLGQDFTIRRRSFQANGQIEDIKAKYKYPLSAALGGSRLISKARVFGAVSWYSSLKKYTVMDPGTASFIKPPSAENALSRLESKMKI